MRITQRKVSCKMHVPLLADEYLLSFQAEVLTGLAKRHEWSRLCQPKANSRLSVEEEDSENRIPVIYDLF